MMRRMVIWCAVLGISLMCISGCEAIEAFGDGLLRQSSTKLVTRIVLQVDAPSESYTTEQVRQSADILRSRLYDLGVSLPEVLVKDNGAIEVLLPAVPDVNEIVTTLTESAVLEFVDFAGLSAAVVEYEGRVILTTYQAEQGILNGRDAGAETPDVSLLHPDTGEPFDTVLTQDALSTATAQLDDNTLSWHIVFELTPEAGEIFGAHTESHIGEPLAIVLNGVVVTVPHIQAKITTGGIISGNFSESEAKSLAVQLNTGALKLPLALASIESITP